MFAELLSHAPSVDDVSIDPFKDQFIKAVFDNAPFKITQNIGPYQIEFISPNAEEYAQLDSHDSDYNDFVFTCIISKICSDTEVIYDKNDYKDLDARLKALSEKIKESPLNLLVAYYGLIFYNVFTKLVKAAVDPDFFQPPPSVPS